MRTKIRLQYCGMDGEGATMREAKQDAAQRIQRFLTMQVRFGMYRGVTYLIEPQTDGRWAYSWNHGYERDGPIHYRTHTGTKDKEECFHSLCQHIDSVADQLHLRARNEQTFETEVYLAHVENTEAELAQEKAA